MADLYIIAGIRTPFCRMGSDFDALGADDLGRLACTALLTRTGIDPGMIDESSAAWPNRPMPRIWHA